MIDWFRDYIGMRPRRCIDALAAEKVRTSDEAKPIEPVITTPAREGRWDTDWPKRPSHTQQELARITQELKPANDDAEGDPPAAA